MSLESRRILPRGAEFISGSMDLEVFEFYAFCTLLLASHLMWHANYKNAIAPEIASVFFANSHLRTLFFFFIFSINLFFTC